MRYSLVFVFLFLAIGCTGMAAGAQATNPTHHNITISTDGDQFGGGTKTVGAETPVNISAEVPADSPPGTVLRTVTVRVNDQIYRNYEPGTQAFAETITPSLDRGRNSIRVIVEDTNGTVSSRRGTLIVDTFPPQIELTEPATGSITDVNSVEVSTAVVNISGQLRDNSEVSFVEGRLRRNIERSGRTVPTLVDSFRESNPGGEFSQQFVLRKGTTNVLLTTEDEHGNSQQYFFSITLTNESQLNLSVDPVSETTTQENIVVSGTATDGIWVREVDMTVRQPAKNQSQPYGLVPERAYRPTRARLAVDFSKEIRLRPGENVVNITATNHNGQTKTVTKTIRYNTDLNALPSVPQVEISQLNTQFLDTNTLRLVGGVSDDVGIRIVSIESRSGDSIVDYESSSPDSPYHPIDTRLTLPDGESKVLIRVVDSSGNRIRRTIEINSFDVSIQNTTVLANNSVRVTATVSSTNPLGGASVFARDPVSNRLVASQDITSLPAAPVLTINRTLAVGEGPVVVGVSAYDTLGNRSIATQEVSVSAQPRTPVIPTTDSTTTTSINTTNTTSTSVPTTAMTTAPETEQNATNQTTTPPPNKSSILGTLVGFIVGVIPFILAGVVLVFGSFFAYQTLME